MTTHTGLLAARHVVGADVAVVAQGPGNVGTGTRWGYSGVACADALHAAEVLGGRGVASLRVSGADRRERHRGISHHSRTAYGRALLTPADVPVTTLPDAELDALVRAQLAELVGAARAAPHRRRGAGRRAARGPAHLTGGPDDDGAGSG